MTRLQKLTAIPLGAVLLLGGGAIAGYATLASAQTSTTSTGTSATAEAPDTDTQHQFDPSKGGHVGQNGVKEEVLTGDTAAKVTAAALASQPGATIERVESDAEGAVYEAHMVKSDGSHVTVKFDSNFNVTATETGFGGHR